MFNEKRITIYSEAIRLRGGALPTVMTISVLMLLIVMMMLSLSDIETMIFMKYRQTVRHRDYLESALTLYSIHPEIIPDNQNSVTIKLFDDDDQSQVTIEREMWGLYEKIRITSSKISSSYLVGMDNRGMDAFWYRNNGATLTLTGQSSIDGRLALPDNGIVYGNMGSLFFSGQEIDPNLSRSSEDQMPAVRWYVDTILDSKIDDHVRLDSESAMSNSIVIARKVNVDSGFCGSVQIFATDSIVVGQGVRMNAPSGLYAGKYIEIGDHSQIQGYVISANDSSDSLGYKQYPLAGVNGLIYVEGCTQLQGAVSGNVVLNKARYYTASGFYEDMLCGVSITQDDMITLPVGFMDRYKRKKAVRIR